MMNQRIRGLTKKLMLDQPILLLFLVFIIVMSIVNPNFVTMGNLRNILIDVSIYGVAALAMTIAIICGEFDLSLSANFAMSQIVFCYLLNRWGEGGLSVLASLLCMLALSTLVGCFNGLVVVFGKINSFIATMGMSAIVKGLTLSFTSGDMISTSNEFVRDIGKGTFAGISYLTCIFIVIIAAAFFMMKYTRFGRNIYATGGNYGVAMLAGIKVKFYKFIVFVILGFAAGMAGALFVCLMRAGSVLYGTDLALTCVAATVIGGTPLTGGKGNVLKTVVGILLLYVLYRVLAFLGVQGYYNTMIKGIVLLVVVSVDAYLSRSGNVLRNR